jgi:hypothetical protein
MTNRRSEKSPPATDTSSSASIKRTEGRLGREVQAKIGRQLRTMYEEVVKEGIPDRFRELLRQLDEKAAKDRR